MDELRDVINLIQSPDEDAMRKARERQDYLAKVPGSLGALEDISVRLAGITGKPWGNDVKNQAIILMCADNGVVEEGVASAPQSVTLMQTVNFTKGITGVSSQAKYFGIHLLVMDVGVKSSIPEENLTESILINDSSEEVPLLSGKVVDRKISAGTKNFLKTPAMTREEAVRGIHIGIEAAEACKKARKSIIGVGEMGIGNTTTAAAIIAALAQRCAGEVAENQDSDHVHDVKKMVDTGSGAKRKIAKAEDLDAIVSEVVGRGGGLSDLGLKKKREVIGEALKKYEPLYMTEDGLEPIELLRCVGGFDIAGMVGAYIGAALHRIPAVVDGVISIAAALLACEICPAVKNYIFTSHKSKESGYMIAADLLGVEPMFDLGMRLGEGSGCPIAFKIIEAACAVMNGMKTLEEAQVDAAYLDEFREDGQFQ